MTSLEDPRWLALSEERRDALLEKHRNTNVEHVEWWDSVYEQFVESCTEKGIEVDTHTIETVGGKLSAIQSTSPVSGVRATVRASTGMSTTGQSSWSLAAVPTWCLCTRSWTALWS